MWYLVDLIDKEQVNKNTDILRSGNSIPPSEYIVPHIQTQVEAENIHLLRNLFHNNKRYILHNIIDISETPYESKNT